MVKDGWTWWISYLDLKESHLQRMYEMFSHPLAVSKVMVTRCGMKGPNSLLGGKKAAQLYLTSSTAWGSVDMVKSRIWRLP